MRSRADGGTHSDLLHIWTDPSLVELFDDTFSFPLEQRGHLRHFMMTKSSQTDKDLEWDLDETSLHLGSCTSLNFY